MRTGIGIGSRHSAVTAWQRWLRTFLTAEILEDLFILAGALGVGLMWIVSAIINYGYRYGYEDFLADELPLALLTAMAFFLVRRGFVGPDPARADERKALIDDLKALAIVAALVVIVGFFGKSVAAVSRGWYLGWLFGSAAALSFVRLTVDKHVVARLSDVLAYRVVLVGAQPNLQSMDRFFRERVHGVQPTARLSLSSADPDLRRLVDDIRQLAIEGAIDAVVIGLPLRDEATARRVVEALLAVPVDIYLWLEGAGEALVRHGLLEGSEIPWMRVARRPMRDWGRIGKAILDRVGAAVLLVAFSPLLLLVAIAIKLDSSGPVFFKQLRYGYGRTPFVMWKFRTMYHDRSDLGRQFRQATKGDPRVTRVGRLLRRTSIDELPQLINVLRGEMSLVGPRPHAVAMDESYERTIDLYAARLRVRPGMTGWAQVNGCRGETDSEDKIRLRIAYDLFYMRHWSLWFDFWILLLTLFRGFVHRNAY